VPYHASFLTVSVVPVFYAFSISYPVYALASVAVLRFHRRLDLSFGGDVVWTFKE
jgi:hypothetical protein